MWSFVIGLFPWHDVLQGFLCCVSALHFFLTNNIPLYRFTTSYSSMYQPVDIWVLSTIMNNASVNASV